MKVKLRPVSTFWHRRKKHKSCQTEVGSRVGRVCILSYLPLPKNISLARGTVGIVIVKLRSIFSLHDRVGDWNAALGFGNPAASKDVKDDFSNITAEQLQARVTPLQSTPLLLSDLKSWPNRVASRRKLKTWVYTTCDSVWPGLACTCVDLR